jgi:hypothetical protein
MELGQRRELADQYQVNAFANGWCVSETGKYSVTLEFIPQPLFEIGVITSYLNSISCIAYLAGEWFRRRRD